MKTVAIGLVFLSAAQMSFAQPHPGTVLWTYDVGYQTESSPVLGLDSTVYVQAFGLWAVTNSGATASNKWRSFLGQPAIASDGTIYLLDVGGLRALNPDASQKWYYPAVTQDGSFYRRPAISQDNTIYFVGAGVLYAITSTGTEKWNYDIGGTTLLGVNSPVVGSDGTIYAGLEDYVYAISPYGTNKWTLHNRFWRGPGTPAIGANGTVYFGSGYLSAFSPEGTNLWSLGEHFTSPAIGLDGTLYADYYEPAFGGSRHLHAISPDGQIRWKTNLGSFFYPGNPTVPAIDAGGRIYHCVSNSVWALTSQGQVLWRVTTSETGPADTELANNSPTIGPDGTLYAAIGRTLYAIATGTNGPANSPWPMDRQNARHTGKVEKPALRQPQKRSDANFQFQLYGQLGQTFTVEASTNFNTWTSVTSIVANTLPVDVVDLTASNHPSRFYRASSPP